MKATHLLTLLLTLALATDGHAQTDTLPRVDIPGTQVLKLTSSIVPGQEYQFYVLPPQNYQRDTNKAYPVVYLLDGQYDFPFLTGVYGGQYYDGQLPEFFIVGITWGGKNVNYGTIRGRDFTPTTVTGMESGNAPKFLEFIKKECIPFIASKYRVTDDRTLVGSSLGGLFTLYALFNEPSLFRRYVLTSPSVAWDNNILRTYEKKYETNGFPSPVRVFIGKGGLESDLSDFQEFAEWLKAKQLKNLELNTLVIAGIGHAGGKPEGYARGLLWAFERPSLVLPINILNRYTGTYVVGNDTVNLLADGGRLVAIAPGNFRITLEAESSTDFYHKGEFLNVHFKPDDAGKVSGFELEQYDNSIFVKKVK